MLLSDKIVNTIKLPTSQAFKEMNQVNFESFELEGEELHKVFSLLSRFKFAVTEGQLSQLLKNADLDYINDEGRNLVNQLIYLNAPLKVEDWERLLTESCLANRDIYDKSAIDYMAQWVAYDDEIFFSEKCWYNLIMRSNPENLYSALVDICDTAHTTSFLNFEQWTMYINRLEIRGLKEDSLDLLSALTTPLDAFKHLKIGQDNFVKLVGYVIHPGAEVEERALSYLLETPDLIESIWPYVEYKEFLVAQFRQEEIDLSSYPFIEKYILNSLIENSTRASATLKI